VNVVLKLLQAPNSSQSLMPAALVLNYPALDFRFTSWMTPAQLSILRAEHKKSSSHISGLAEQKDHFAHKSPLAVVSDAKVEHPRPRSQSVRHRTNWTDTHGGGARRRSLLFRPPVGSSEGTEEDGNEADSETNENMAATAPSVEECDMPIRARVQSPEPSILEKNSRKKPFETRLTMTSRVGYFQDKIISPSMVRPCI
jgi:hypothetical protein